MKDVFHRALEQPRDERAAFVADACAGDDTLARDVRSLLGAHDEAGSFLSEPAATDFGTDLTGRRVGPYRVVGKIGQGGMGAVFRAVRDDDVFEKTVALKVVRGDAGPEALRRFARERQILARLQHPNIAAILDGGETDEGLPYLIMEHVEGHAIDAFCDERALGLRERLELFSTVCAAVHYAHQNLIVHRDLKPSNILVGADGRPKLLDFGIAALLGPPNLGDGAEAATATLFPALTPDYASPEQIRGLPLTTASDVYSLGVVAYQLLAGELPLRVRASSMEAMVRTLCETDPAPPSQVARSRVPAAALRGDLDTIVSKALRKEPERRYASAQALAEDIGRHLAGRPVLARKDTVGYRMGKFLGRHRAAAVATAVAAGLAAFGVAAVVHEGRLAEANRIRAERRFADVRRMANSLLFELHDAIKDLPGSTDARALVLRRALEYLDSLAAEAGGDTALVEELATAYAKVADVQGSPFGANLGDVVGAAATVRKEVALRQALAERAPGDQALALAYLVASRRLALLDDEAGRTQAAVERLRGDAAAIDALAARPDGDAARRQVARFHGKLGFLIRKTGDVRGGLEEQRRALALAKAQSAAHPGDAEALRDVHLILGELARTLAKSGARPEAIEHYREAVAAAEAGVELRPDDPRAKRDLNNGYGNLAEALGADGQFDEARRTLGRVVAFDEERLAADGRDAQAQDDLTWDLATLAQLEIDAGRFAEALVAGRRALELAEASLRQSPKSFRARVAIAEGSEALARILAGLDRLDEAAAMGRRAVDEFEGLRATNPGYSRIALLLARSYADSAGVDARLAAAKGRAALWRQARASSLRVLEAWGELERRGGLDADNRPRLAGAAAVLVRCDAALARGIGKNGDDR